MDWQNSKYCQPPPGSLKIMIKSYLSCSNKARWFQRSKKRHTSLSPLWTKFLWPSSTSKVEYQVAFSKNNFFNIVADDSKTWFLHSYWLQPRTAKISASIKCWRLSIYVVFYSFIQNAAKELWLQESMLTILLKKLFGNFQLPKCGQTSQFRGSLLKSCITNCCWYPIQISAENQS